MTYRAGCDRYECRNDFNDMATIDEVEEWDAAHLRLHPDHADALSAEDGPYPIMYRWTSTSRTPRPAKEKL